MTLRLAASYLHPKRMRDEFSIILARMMHKPGPGLWPTDKHHQYVSPKPTSKRHRHGGA